MNGAPLFKRYAPIPTAAQKAAAKAPESTLDTSLLGLVTHWHLVVVDMLSIYGMDLYDPALLARPWLGVRSAIEALYTHPDSRLRRALTRR